MTFKPALWFPIAVVLSAVNLVAVGVAAGDMWWHPFAHAALALGFGLWAQRLRQSRAAGRAAPSESDVPGIEEQLDAAQAALADQSAQLAELQERVDFAERLLVQARERSSPK